MARGKSESGTTRKQSRNQRSKTSASRSSSNRRSTSNGKGASRNVPDFSIIDPEEIDEAVDVFVDAPVVKVDEIKFEIDDLRAHLAVLAEAGHFVQLNAGAAVRLGKVELDIQNVETQALLEVRLGQRHEDPRARAHDARPQPGAAQERRRRARRRRRRSSRSARRHGRRRQERRQGSRERGSGRRARSWKGRRPASVSGAQQGVEGLGEGAQQGVEGLGQGAQQGVEGVGQGAEQGLQRPGAGRPAGNRRTERGG